MHANSKEFDKFMYHGSLKYNVHINKDLELHISIMERYLMCKRYMQCS